MRFTTIPFLLALIVALQGMPTNVYQVCRQEVGTLDTEPWRAKLTELAGVRQIARAVDRFREWCAELASVPLLVSETGEAALDLLVPGGGSRLKALRQRAEDIDREIGALADTLAARGITGVYTDEERTKLNALREARKTNAEALADAEAANERIRNAPAPAPSSDANASAAAVAVAKVGEKPSVWKSAGVGSISGEMLQAVYRAGISNGVDPRLLAAASGLNETVPSEGGFLVGTDMADGIKQRMYEVGEILKRVFKLPLGPNSNGIKVNMVDETSRANGSRYGGIVSYWLAEAAEKTASKPKFRQALLELKKVAALVYGTDEILQDSTALEAWIQKFLPLELQFKVEDSIINGTGAGQPLGILNSGATVAVTRANAGEIGFTDVQAMWSRMYAPSRKNAVWHVDQGVEPSLETLNIPVGTGGVLAPVYKPAGSSPGQEFATLYGRPIIPTEYNAALGTIGDIILADWDEYMLIEKGGVQSASSMHVRFVFDETAFRFVYRVDGQPNWNAPLTPKSAGATLSPFVTLAT